jgi:hypothetical protein
VSGSPTTERAGIPLAVSTSTSTVYVSIPIIAPERVLDSIKNSLFKEKVKMKKVNP